MIFTRVSDLKSKLYKEIVALGDKNSKTLGFLPKSAFAKYTQDKQIIASCRNNTEELLGYLLYRVSYNKVTIVHLCISEKARNQKVALGLVNYLKKHTKQFDGIKLSCRNDYKIDHVWESFNFVPVKERVGRSKEGLPLTVWWYPHHQNDLFSQISDYEIKNKIVAVIDMNVFLDIKDEREEESLALKSDWLLSEAILYYSREIHTEINRAATSEIKASSRKLLNNFNELPFRDEEEFKKVLYALKKEFPEKSQNDKSDLKHLAYSVTGGAQFFITRDKDLLQNKSFFKKYELQVCRPSEFITRLDENIHVSKYKPQRLIGTSINSKRVTSENIDFFTDKFLKPCEKKDEFFKIIKRALSSPNNYELITISKGKELLAFFIFDRTNKEKLSIPVYRFLSSGLKITLSKHLLFKAILTSTREKRSEIEITESYLEDDIITTILEARFIAEKNSWKKFNLNVTVDYKEIPSLVGQNYYKKIEQTIALPETDENFHFHLKYTLERHLAPLKIKDLELPTYVIPIKPVWAEQLFDDNSGEKLPLFESEDKLLLNRENVYYRTSSKGSLLAPARILWYVSQNTTTKERGQIRATSYVDEIFIDDSKKLFKQFKDLGIYKWKDINKTANKENKIMAFIFSDTELFDSAVNLKFLRELFLEVENKNFMVMAPTKIKNETYLAIYKKGMNKGK